MPESRSNAEIENGRHHARIRMHIGLLSYRDNFNRTVVISDCGLRNAGNPHSKIRIPHLIVTGQPSSTAPVPPRRTQATR